MDCIAIGTAKHGKWTYHTVVIYTTIQLKDGRTVWSKHDVIVSCSTYSKALRLANEESMRRNIPLIPSVRQFHPVKPA